MSPSLLRTLQVSAVLVLVIFVIGVIPAGTSAAPGTSSTSASTFRLRPDKERVDVQVRMSISNRTPSRVTTGPCPNAPSRRCRITTRYYVDAMGVVLPTAARKVRFKGKGLSSRIIESKYGWAVHKVSFAPVFQGQTRKIHVTYQLPAAGPRARNTTRVTDAYAHFCWFGQPTDKGTVTAFVPRGYETSTQYGKVKVGKTKQGVRMKAVRTRKPGKFYACTETFHPDRLLRTETVSPSGSTVTVEGWPEDPEWTEAITEGIGTTLPALEELIAVPGLTDDLTIRQVAMQALAGYAGDFHPGTGRIRVSEQLDDPELVAHEMAHAWFNDGTMAETWMIEAYAEWAGQAVTGGRCDDPGDYPGKGSPELRDWRFVGANPSDRDLDVIEYQYAAACSIAEQVADLVGEDRMGSVTRSLLLRYPKYTGDWMRERAAPDWREWLDAVDEVGLVPAGVTDLEFAERLLVEEGIARTKQLRGRAEARAAYHEALDGSLAGAMPMFVREAMDAWKWDKALKGIAIAEEAMLEAERQQAVAEDPQEMRLLRSRLLRADTLAALRRIRDEVLARSTVDAASGSVAA